MAGLDTTLGCKRELFASLPNVSSCVGATVTGTAMKKGTITFASSHGLRVGDVLTLTGADPSGWNGSWTIVQTPTSTTAVIHTGTGTALANTTTQPTATATKWGGGGTPNRFLEATSHGLTTVAERLQSAGIRAGDMVAAADRMVVYPKDATGPLTVDLWDQGHEFLWHWILGAVATSGPGGDGEYTHTFTPSRLRGVSYTVQRGVPDSNDTVWPFTFKGVKVTKATITLEVDKLVTLQLELDGQSHVLDVAHAAPSFASDVNLLSFIGGTFTVGGTAWAIVKKVTIEISPSLDVNRRGLGSSQKAEQLMNGKWDISVNMDAELSDLSQDAKVRATIPADTVAEVVLSAVGPVAIGTTTYPSATITLGSFRVDSAPVTTDGPGLVMQQLTGKALNSAAGTNDAIEVVVVSAASSI